MTPAETLKKLEDAKRLLAESRAILEGIVYSEMKYFVEPPMYLHQVGMAIGYVITASSHYEKYIEERAKEQADERPTE